jgi:hypothetical protein
MVNILRCLMRVVQSQFGSIRGGILSSPECRDRRCGRVLRTAQALLWVL